jgi:hypothetical protein
MLKMSAKQFFEYLDRRKTAMAKGEDATDEGTKMVISSEKGNLECLTWRCSVVPDMLLKFKDNFTVKRILPGGEWCMMNAVSDRLSVPSLLHKTEKSLGQHCPMSFDVQIKESARPFMGPNMYITPGGGFTLLHQDGHGTVDSGHLLVSGYNEVVMLRRLPERHKVAACQSLPPVGDEKKEEPIRRCVRPTAQPT